MTKTEDQTITEIMRNFELKTNDKIEKIHINQARMNEQTQNIDKSLTSINNKLDNFIKCADEVYANKQAVNTRLNDLEEKRIGKLEKNIDWIVKIVIGVVLAAILGLVIIK